jgi:nucleoside-diphosphate-sugar epimerase
MKILVAGGAGFIGHKLSRHLKDTGYDLRIVDSLTNYNNSIIKSEHDYLVNTRLNGVSDISCIHHDINDAFFMPFNIQNFKPDVVVNLAAFSRVKLVHDNPAIASDTMIRGLFNLLNSCLDNNGKPLIKRFIQVSSSMVYGDWPNSGIVIEDDICTPKSYYGILKLAGEDIVKQFCKINSIEYVIIRPSAVYGPYDCEDRVVTKFLKTAMNNKTLSVNGSSSVDFTYIDDFIEGFERCININYWDRSRNETFNITRGNARTLEEAAWEAINIAKSDSGTLMVGDNTLFPNRGVCSISKAQSLLDFYPSTDIGVGFNNTFKWLTEKYDL